MKERDEYWMCIIGPTKRSEHPRNGEGPLRMVVQDAFHQIFGRDAAECSSGFETEATKKQIEKIEMKSFSKLVKAVYNKSVPDKKEKSRKKV